jgi:hypothetical protein
LNLKYDELPSNFAFEFNLRRYIKGVSWNKNAGAWTANRKGTWLGYHTTEEAAAGTDRKCSPSHQAGFEPKFPDSIGIL